MRLGAEYMDAAKRQDILLQISNGGAKEARILEVTSTIPAWVQRPFKEDQENFNQALDVYRKNAPIVKSVNQRLSQSAGPVWPDLTQNEIDAINNWEASVGNLEAYVNTYFPSQTQQYIGQVALVVIAVGALVAPLFMGEEKLGLPFRVKFPFAKPPKAAREPGTSLAPRGLVARRPVQVEAEVYRPGSMRRLPPPPPSAAESREAPYRTFVRPLSPGGPVPEREPVAVRSTSASPGSPRIFPRYRRP